MTQVFLLGIPGGSSNSDTSVKKMSRDALVEMIFFLESISYVPEGRALLYVGRCRNKCILGAYAGGYETQP